MSFRIGFGYDVHRLEAGVPFYIGGVELPAEKGAVGHSDADVLIHAICDAMLGAANLGDIGQHFPDTDKAYEGFDSKQFLKQVNELIAEKGYKVVNIDSTVCLEKPKVGPHMDAMKTTMGDIIGCSADDISIKATTSEKMGFVGRENGVAAYAVVLIGQS